MGCYSLKYVDLVEAAELHETAAALHLEEWRSDMSGEIDLINQILPSAPAGGWEDGDDGEGEKTQAIRSWIRSVLKQNYSLQSRAPTLIR